MTTEQTLSSYLREVLEQRHLSGNQLSQLAGISEGSVRNLLKQGVEEEVSGPHPLVLKAICQVLQLDEVYVFQLAGYLSDEPLGKSISPAAEYFGLRFDQLPADKQKILWDLLDSVEKSSGILPPGENVRYLLERVRQLQKVHPMFKARKFGLVGELGRILGNVTRTSTPDLLQRMTYERLQEAASLPPAIQITEQEYEQAIADPNVLIVLNTLLPRKDIPTAWEKLFWLTHPSGTLDKRFSLIAEEYQQGIRALWELLAEITQKSGQP